MFDMNMLRDGRRTGGSSSSLVVVVVVVVAVAVVVVVVLVLVLAVGAGRSAAAAAAAFRRCRQYVSEVCSALIFDAASELSRLPKFA